MIDNAWPAVAPILQRAYHEKQRAYVASVAGHYGREGLKALNPTAVGAVSRVRGASLGSSPEQPTPFAPIRQHHT